MTQRDREGYSPSQEVVSPTEKQKPHQEKSPENRPTPEQAMEIIKNKLATLKKSLTKAQDDVNNPENKIMKWFRGMVGGSEKQKATRADVDEIQRKIGELESKHARLESISVVVADVFGGKATKEFESFDDTSDVDKVATSYIHASYRVPREAKSLAEQLREDPYALREAVRMVEESESDGDVFSIKLKSEIMTAMDEIGGVHNSKRRLVEKYGNEDEDGEKVLKISDIPDNGVLSSFSSLEYSLGDQIKLNSQKRTGLDFRSKEAKNSELEFYVGKSEKLVKKVETVINVLIRESGKQLDRGRTLEAVVSAQLPGDDIQRAQFEYAFKSGFEPEKKPVGWDEKKRVDNVNSMIKDLVRSYRTLSEFVQEGREKLK